MISIIKIGYIIVNFTKQKASCYNTYTATGSSIYFLKPKLLSYLILSVAMVAIANTKPTIQNLDTIFGSGILLN